MTVLWKKENVKISPDQKWHLLPWDNPYEWSSAEEVPDKISLHPRFLAFSKTKEVMGTVLRFDTADGGRMPTVMVTYDGELSNNPVTGFVTGSIEYILLNHKDLGLTEAILGTGHGDSDDTLVFHLTASQIRAGDRSAPKSIDAAGLYVDGDNKNFYRDEYKFLNWAPTYVDSFAIKIDSSDKDLASLQYEAVRTAVHELIHRLTKNHPYTRIGYGASLDALMKPLNLDEIINDETYTKTREVMARLVQAGKIQPPDGMSKATIEQDLLKHDQKRLQVIQRQYEMFRKGLLVDRIDTIAEVNSLSYEKQLALAEQGIIAAVRDKNGAVVKKTVNGQEQIVFRPLDFDTEFQTGQNALAALWIKTKQAPLGNAFSLIDTVETTTERQTLKGNFVQIGLGGIVRSQGFSAYYDPETGRPLSFVIDGVDFLDGLDAGTASLIVAVASGLKGAIENPTQAAGDGNIILPTGEEISLATTQEEGKHTVAISFPNYESGVNLTTDSLSRKVVITLDSINGKLTEKVRHTFENDLIIIENADGPTQIRFRDSPVNIDFVDAGEAIGSVLGSYLAKGDKITGIVASAALRTIGSNLGDILNSSFFSQSNATSKNIEKAFDGFEEEFYQNLKGAATGAISSYLTAELINAIGLDGFAAELANSAGGGVIGQMAANLANGADIFTGLEGVKSLAAMGQAVGSFLGAKLAGELVSFDTVGGQLGAAIGSMLGSAALGPMLAKGLAVVFSGFAGPVGAAIGAFVGFIAGGLIGSLFGGTPRSGADVIWDERSGAFTVGNLWSKKGGSKEAAQNVALSVAGTYNGIMGLVGGVILNPQAVQAGNYGMRGKKFVYRPVSSRDKVNITASFKGEDAADKLINYGAYLGLSDTDFKIAGGDLYLKRALYNSLELAHGNAERFEIAALMGDLKTAQQFDIYLQNSVSIGALITAEPDSVFAAEWALVLSRAVELGLQRRHISDWYGGFAFILKEAGALASDVEFQLVYDQFSGRLARQNIIGGYVYQDNIDTAGQDIIEGSSGSDVIKLSGENILETQGNINNSIKVNGKVFGGQMTAVDVASIIQSGDGDDYIESSDRGDTVLGGAGNDTILGGKLADWLFGGDGDDVLNAGSSSGVSLGGDGNYLNGGAGNDTLRGREGSDWLEGGEGADTLTGGAGGDILAGGAGDNDWLYGGAGGDQYIYRMGDGADWISDDPGEGWSAADDPITERLEQIENGTVGRDWLADHNVFRSGAPMGGDDSLVLGAGIGLGDIRLMRGGAVAGTTDKDLILQVMTTDASGARVFSGNQMVMRDWFNSLKRVEWLVLSDGQAIRIGDFTSFIVGTAGDDVIIGSYGNDFVVGGDGNDIIELLPGFDVGTGGKGRDFISGDAHNDLIVGGDDDDHLTGGTGDDVVSGDSGNDDIYGGAGQDILSGGRGNDFIAGGVGADIFRYSRGDGQDTVIDAFAGIWEVIYQDGSYVNGYAVDYETNKITKDDEVIFDGLEWLYRLNFDYTSDTLERLIPDPGGAIGRDGNGYIDPDALEFGLGINVQDVMLHQDGHDLVLGISTENSESHSFDSLTDRITLKDWYRTDNRPIETFVFTATGTLDAEETNLIGGTDGEDTLTGGAGSDWITGNGSNDIISGGSGADILAGNAGSDVLDGGDGQDILYGGAGNDILEGGEGADVLVGGDGEDTASYVTNTSSIRVYLGYSHTNTYDAYNDTYESIDNITGSKNGDRLGGNDGDNIITGGGGWDVMLGNAGDDTYFITEGTTGTLRITEGKFVVEEAVGRDGKLKDGYSITHWAPTGINYADGRSYWRLQVTGPDGEIVYDYDKYTVVEENGTQPPSPSGFIVNEGSNVVGWRGGFLRTSGQQVTREKFDLSADGGHDVIELDTDISFSDLNGAWAGDELTLSFRGASRAIKITNQRDINQRVEEIQFADGFSIGLTNLLFGWNVTLAGTAGDDTFLGGSGNEVYSGHDGDDALAGYTGNDRLYGGSGNDTFEGGRGSRYTRWRQRVRHYSLRGLNGGRSHRSERSHCFRRRSGRRHPHQYREHYRILGPWRHSLW